MIVELEEIKSRFGDRRRTEISDAAADIENEDLIPQKNIIIALTKNGYIKRVDDDTFSAQHRGGVGVTGMKTVGNDIVRLIKHTKTHTDILFFSSLGKVYRLRGHQIPDSGRTGKGVPAQNFLNLDKDEKVVAIMPCEDYPEDNYLFFVTKNGIVKRTSLREFASIHSNGKIAVGLREGDDLFDVKRTCGNDIVALASSNGKLVSFYEEDVRAMGRTAAGVRGMDLGDGSEIVGIAVQGEGDKILVLTNRGYGKISYAKDTDTEDGRHYDGYRLTKRGAKGVITVKASQKTGKLVIVRAVNGDEDLLVVTTKGIVIRTPLSEVKIASRNTMGVKIISVEDSARVASVAIIPHSDVSDEDEFEEGTVDNDDVIESEGEEEAVEEVVTPDEVA